MTTWYLSKWRGSVTCTSPGLKNRYGNWLGWMSTCRNISTRTLFYRFCLYHESYYSTIVHTPTAVCLPAGWFKIWYAYKTISPSRRFKKRIFERVQSWQRGGRGQNRYSWGAHRLRRTKRRSAIVYRFKCGPGKSVPLAASARHAPRHALSGLHQEGY